MSLKREHGNPFSTLGIDWCRTCRSEVDTNTEASHRRGMYIYKRWCRACGQVLAYGTYHAPLLTDAPLQAAALEWVTRPGRDRR